MTLKRSLRGSKEKISDWSSLGMVRRDMAGGEEGEEDEGGVDFSSPLSYTSGCGSEIVYAHW